MGPERRRRGRLAAVCTIAALSVAPLACSSSDPVPSAEPTTSASPETAPPTTRDVAGDTALAESALLTLDELPGGPWTEGDARDDEPGTGIDCPAMATETEYFAENAKGAPGAKAPDYTDDTTGAELSLDVNIVANDEVAETVATFFADDRFAACLEDKLIDPDATGSSAVVSDPSVQVVSTDPVGESSAVWSVSFTIDQGTQSLDISGLVAFVQVGRGFANVSLVGSQTFTVDDIVPILDAAAAKLDSTLA